MFYLGKLCSSFEDEEETYRDKGEILGVKSTLRSTALPCSGYQKSMALKW